MSFLFLITPVQSIGGLIIINRNQFDINVYLISVEPHLHKITGQFNWPKINWPIF